ncbi:ArgE/DapE family deacylase [Sulfurisphaera tokodaii]|uniref:Probable succinyl-diaminopimelate desuccinylase n=2 Tax=Sulfurisphaera tokodaii TaxID=111955 RepID=Q970S3_SULTO|nr:ArgE/DapE family deacylase [Sulfurisphaera tokodaii]BAB66600.1 putative acetylornithine deacetylase [Sulfurisphaera tokodaii str. 7]HII73582.1 ArgE/DapE family deacylase [Sulfurisphaera tokodaii]
MEIEELTSKLIQFPTVNPPAENLHDCASFIKDYLSSQGFSSQVIEFEKGWPVVISENGNKNDKLIMLNGHYDVVPTGDVNKWKYNPFSGKIIDDKVYGRGSTDMKGGLAVFMKVFTEIADKVNYNLIFTAVPDEESGGDKGSKYLADRYKPDLVLISEPSGSDSINIGEKGLLQVKLIAKGKVAHGSLPSLGENAIMKLVKDLIQLEKIKEIEIKIPDNLIEAMTARIPSEIAKNDVLRISFNPGVIKGGVKVNVVPDYAEVEVDMRIPPGINSGEALNIVRSLVKQGEIIPLDISEPNYTPPDNEFVKKLENIIYKQLGIKAKKYIITGATDGRYFRYKGVPVIVYGPGELGMAHAYDEFISFKELRNSYTVIKDYLLTLF